MLTRPDPTKIMDQILEFCPPHREFARFAVIFSELPPQIVWDNFLMVLTTRIEAYGWVSFQIPPTVTPDSPLASVLEFLRRLLQVDAQTIEQNNASPPHQRMLQFGNYLLPPFFMTLDKITEIFRVIGGLASSDEAEQLFEVRVPGVTPKKRVIFTTIFKIIEKVLEETPDQVGFLVIAQDVKRIDALTWLWLQCLISEQSTLPLVFWGRFPSKKETIPPPMQELLSIPSNNVIHPPIETQTSSFKPAASRPQMKPVQLSSPLREPLEATNNERMAYESQLNDTPQLDNTPKSSEMIITPTSPENVPTTQIQSEPIIEPLKPKEIPHPKEIKPLKIRPIEVQDEQIEKLPLKASPEPTLERILPSGSILPTEEAKRLALESQRLFDKLFVHK